MVQEARRYREYFCPYMQDKLYVNMQHNYVYMHLIQSYQQATDRRKPTVVSVVDEINRGFPTMQAT